MTSEISGLLLEGEGGCGVLADEINFIVLGLRFHGHPDRAVLDGQMS